jgi:hypothetical protein
MNVIKAFGYTSLTLSIYSYMLRRKANKGKRARTGNEIKTIMKKAWI